VLLLCFLLCVNLSEKILTSDQANAIVYETYREHEYSCGLSVYGVSGR
jgi:hypothetical protein